MSAVSLNEADGEMAHNEYKRCLFTLEGLGAAADESLVLQAKAGLATLLAGERRWKS